MSKREGGGRSDIGGYGGADWTVVCHVELTSRKCLVYCYKSYVGVGLSFKLSNSLRIVLPSLPLIMPHCQDLPLNEHP